MSINDAAEDFTGTGSGTPPPEAPEPQAPESAGDSGTPEDTPDGEDSEEQRQARQQPRYGASAQSRINRLTRDKYELAGRLKEMERRLNEQPQQRTPEPPAQPQGKPKPSDYPGDWEAYNEALIDWTAEQKTQRILEKQREEQYARQSYEHEMRLNQQWQSRLNPYRAQTPDFEAVLAATEDIQVPPYLQHEILAHEHGPQLAYELAKQPAELQRIVSLPPASAVRELGKFEARNNIGHQRPPSISSAPEPVRPVGGGSSVSTRDPGSMGFQEYKQWWKKQHARGK